MGVPFGLADKIRDMKKTEKKKSYFIYVHLLLNSARPVASFASQYRGESGVAFGRGTTPVAFPKCLVSNQLRTPRGGVGELGSEFGDKPYGEPSGSGAGLLHHRAASLHCGRELPQHLHR